MIETAPRAAWDAKLAADIIATHADRPGAALPIMHALQDVFGCVPDHAIELIASALNLSRAEIRGIRSFYHDFRSHPPGRHVLKLCRAEACQARGAVRLHNELMARLGIAWHGTTANGRLTLEPAMCLGLCASGPAGMLDDSLLARLDAPALGLVARNVGV